MLHRMQRTPLASASDARTGPGAERRSSQRDGERMRTAGARAAWIALFVLWAPTSAAPSPPVPPDFRPPDTSEICPALEEDYELCVGDTWSGNCPGFVTDARRIGEVYRSELSQHPGWIDALQTINWWGCGPAQLSDLRALLARLDTSEARVVLAQEPYRSLGAAKAPAASAPPLEEADCVTPQTQAEREACAAQNLARAKAEHARVYGACSRTVAPGLADELVEAERNWEQLLALECAGDAYTRDECLAQAYDERAKSIESLHPECAATPSN